MPGLDNLIEFILDKLALKADTGADKSEIAEIAVEFYEKDAASTAASDGSQRPTATVDEKFLDRLIQWLSNHKGVEVFYTHAGTNSSDHVESSSSAKELRLRTTTERMWLAIAGHPPDETKIRLLEFKLLSIIAQHGSLGVPQPELIRLSGQDKRSLPHRTDMLRERGYIEKKPVSWAGMKTSLCTLLKHAQETPDIDIEAALNGPENLFSHFVVNGDTLLPERFLDVSLQVIQKHGLLELDKFREIMGIGAHTSGRKWVKAARKFLTYMVSAGCIQRLSVVFHEKKKRSVDCLKFIQEPSEEARKSICAMTDTVLASTINDGQEKSQHEGSEGGQSEDDEDPENDSNNVTEAPVDSKASVHPSWDPMRPLLNQIFDAVQASGSNGISGVELSTRVFSPFWRRALDVILIQLTELWHVSQPLSLRHLTVVRDSAQKGRVVHYQYYTHEAFSKLVEAGESSWEAVGGDFKKMTETLDEWGFPSIPASALLRGTGCATVSQAYNAAKTGRNRSRQANEFGALTEPDDGLNDSHLETIAPSPVKDAEERRRLGLKPLGRPPKKGPKGKPKAKKPKTSTSANTNQHKESTEPVTGAVALAARETSVPEFPEHDAEHAAVHATQSPQVRTVHGSKSDENGILTGQLQIEANTANIDDSLRRKRPLSVPASPGPHTKKRRTSIQPSSHKSEATREQTNEVHSGSLELSLPGSYLNHPSRTDFPRTLPSARRLNLVIKSERLYQFDWFTSAFVSNPSSQMMELQEGTSGRGEKGRQRSKSFLPDQRLSGVGKDLVATTTTTSGEKSNSDLTPTGDSSSVQMSAPASNLTIINELSTLDEDHVMGNSGIPQRTITPWTPLTSTRSSGTLADSNGEPPLFKHGRDVSLNKTMVTDVRNDKSPENTRTDSQSVSKNAPNQGKTPSKKASKSLKDPNNVRKKDQGSVAWKRSKVLLDAIETAGGLFPGPRELQTLYSQTLPSNSTVAPPDLVTVSRVAKNLVASGKLKKFGFTFAYKGTVQQGTIYALPHFSVDSDEVEKMQTEVIGLHPKKYTPPVVNATNSTQYQSGDKLSSADPVAVPRKKTKLIPSRIISAKQALKELSETSLGFARWADRVNNGEIAHRGRKRKRAVGNYESSDDDETLPPSMTELQHTWSLEDIFEDFAPVSPYGNGVTTRADIASLGPRKRVRFADFNALGTQKSSLSTLLMGVQDFYPNIGVFTTQFGLIEAPDPFQRWSHRSINTRKVRQNTTCFAEWPLDQPVTDQFNAHLEDREAWERKRADELSIDRRSGKSLSYANGIRFLIHGIPPMANTQLQEDRKRSLREDAISRQQDDLSRGLQLHTSRTFATHAGQASYQQIPRPINPAWRISQRAGRVCKWTMCRSDRPLPELLREPAVLGLLASVITVRTILGGQTQTIDWPFVVKLMGKKYDYYVLASQWKQIENSHQAEINLLEYSFQKRFLTAYEARTVPRIRFQDMHTYNWGVLKNWTEGLISQLLDTDTGHSVDQHLKKRDLSDYYTIRPVLVQEQSNEVMFKSQAAITKRIEYIRDTGFFVPITTTKPARDRTLAQAKSLVRAIISTSDENYNAARARTRLSSVPSYALDAAVAELLKEKYIRHLARGRPMPGRNFGYTDNFRKYLQLHARHGKVRSVFSKALEFKRFIDAEFQSKGFYKVTGVADDHHGLVIGNLISEGRLSLEVMTPDVVEDPNYDASAEDINPTAENPSRKLSIWGMARGSYKTSSLNLNHIIFPARIYPTENYVDGIPLPQPLPAPPAPHLGVNPSSKSIPIWYDINDNLLPKVWNKVGLSVIRLMHQRPGITATNIVKAMNNVVDIYDITTAQHWLFNLGVVDEDKMSVKEWWWAVFASEDEFEDDEA